jgi:hypothetical protein
VIIPNSAILNNEVVNFSSLAQQRGLILHTTVGIGYETPWRQVEAMLLLAAERTPGIMKEPPPFVLQKGLGDFSVTYEINVYCDNPKAMAATYTALHRNVLDIFNEYGVQIMTPAYENDPDAPKVVPKEQWFKCAREGSRKCKGDRMNIDDAAALKGDRHVSVGFDKSIAVRKFLRNPMNWLLLFVPLTVALEHVHGLPATVLFFSAAVAILPIAV